MNLAPVHLGSYSEKRENGHKLSLFCGSVRNFSGERLGPGRLRSIPTSSKAHPRCGHTGSERPREAGSWSHTVGAKLVLETRCPVPGQGCVMGDTAIPFPLPFENRAVPGGFLAVKVQLLSCCPRTPGCQSGGLGRPEQHPPSLGAEVTSLAGLGCVAKCTAALAWLEEEQRLSGF